MIVMQKNKWKKQVCFEFGQDENMKDTELNGKMVNKAKLKSNKNDM